MKDAIWFLLITAVGIPVGGLISSHFDRSTATQSALLSAAQKRRDAEIAQMRGALDDLLGAATAVQSYTWFVNKDGRTTTMSRNTFEKYGPLIEGAVVAAQKLRALAQILPPGDLADSYRAVERLIMEVVKGSDDPQAPDPWHEDVSGPQPDTISRAVNATTYEIGRLYSSYPATTPSFGGSPAGWALDAAFLGSILAIGIAAFLAGLFW